MDVKTSFNMEVRRTKKVLVHGASPLRILKYLLTVRSRAPSGGSSGVPRPDSIYTDLTSGLLPEDLQREVSKCRDHLNMKEQWVS